ncbi:MAG TPA: hypothetical protein VF323_10130, partial [Candidatus Limnocylindrales bacterium]
MAGGLDERLDGGLGSAGRSGDRADGGESHLGRIGDGTSVGAGPPTGRRGGRSLAEQRVPAETSIAFAAVRVEDPQIRSPARRPEPVPGDGHLHPLADDVATEPDPRPPGDLQAEAGHLGEGSDHAARQPRRLEDDEQHPGSTGDRRKPTQAVGDTRTPRGTAGRRAPGARTPERRRRGGPAHDT